jgi:hypothetical protein
MSAWVCGGSDVIGVILIEPDRRSGPGLARRSSGPSFADREPTRFGAREESPHASQFTSLSP